MFSPKRTRLTENGVQHKMAWRNLRAEVSALGERYEMMGHRLNYQIVHIGRVPLSSGWNRYETEAKIEISASYPYEEPKIKIPQGLLYTGFDPEEKGAADKDGWCHYRLRSLWTNDHTLLSWMDEFEEEIKNPTINKDPFSSFADD